MPPYLVHNVVNPLFWVLIPKVKISSIPMEIRWLYATLKWVFNLSILKNFIYVCRYICSKFNLLIAFVIYNIYGAAFEKSFLVYVLFVISGKDSLLLFWAFVFYFSKWIQNFRHLSAFLVYVCFKHPSARLSACPSGCLSDHLHPHAHTPP